MLPFPGLFKRQTWSCTLKRAGLEQSSQNFVQLQLYRVNTVLFPYFVLYFNAVLILD